jgi:hypothetical protein
MCSDYLWHATTSAFMRWVPMGQGHIDVHTDVFYAFDEDIKDSTLFMIHKTCGKMMNPFMLA